VVWLCDAIEGVNTQEKVLRNNTNATMDGRFNQAPTGLAPAADDLGASAVLAYRGQAAGAV
jgi:hypothetical protein